MSDFFDNVLVGNVTIDPKVLRDCLKKTCYYMSYYPDTHTIVFYRNTGVGGEVIFELQNAPYESAKKLAEGLGLKLGSGASLTWMKYNPKLFLYDDGSELALSLCAEMNRLGIPFSTYKNKKAGIGEGTLAFFYPMWSIESLMGIIQNTAERYAEELASTP